MQPYKAQDGTSQPFIHNPPFSVIGFRHAKRGDTIQFESQDHKPGEIIQLVHPIAIFSRNRPGKAKRTPKRLRNQHEIQSHNFNRVTRLSNRRQAQISWYSQYHFGRQYQERANARERREGVLA